MDNFIQLCIDENNLIDHGFKYVLKQTLRINHITYQNLEFFNPMSMKIEINQKKSRQTKHIENM